MSFRTRRKHPLVSLTSIRVFRNPWLPGLGILQIDKNNNKNATCRRLVLCENVAMARSVPMARNATSICFLPTKCSYGTWRV